MIKIRGLCIFNKITKYLSPYSLDCPAGTRIADGGVGCTDCPLNEYQPDANQNECIPCPTGQVTTATKSTSEAACVNGWSLTDFYVKESDATLISFSAC